MLEIETKILEVNKDVIFKKFVDIKAEKILDTKLTVDWFRPKEIQSNDDPWYLRIRSTKDGQAEITWKSKPNFIGISKQAKEISLPISMPTIAFELFEAIGLVHYAHQEKFRVSWKYKNWRFDFDQYPNMPPYLEIEGQNEAHLHEAISLLGLQNHKVVSDGERVLIQKEYRLNWYNMRF